MSARPHSDWSYRHGASSVPLLGETTARVLDRAAEQYGDGEALVSCHQSVRFTYSELRKAVERLALSLRGLGVCKGDRLAIWSGSRAEHVLAMLAATQVGAIVVALNPAYRARELEQALVHSGASVLLAARTFRRHDNLSVLLELVPDFERRGRDEWPASRLPSLHAVVFFDDAPAGCWSWSELTGGTGVGEPDAVGADVSPDDPAMILYTSGTTGHPKGVVLSHHSIVNGAFFAAHRLRLTRDDRVCIPLPLCHVLGAVAGVIGGLTHGATVVLPSELFDAGRCLDALERERCTAIYGVPSMFRAQLEDPTFAQRHLQALRTGVISGAACPPDLLRRVMFDLGIAGVTVAYGMTELAPILFTNVNDAVELRESSAGAVQPHVECKVVSIETGLPVALGETGEICARGYARMLSYWNDPVETARAVDAAGWLHTGDLGVMRPDGYVSIVGRLKELVIRGGENISPREIEDVLEAHSDVADAYVVGVPDPVYGEEICAWVRLAADRSATPTTAEQLRQHCRARMSAHKIPRHICFTTEFPITPSGKVQKFRLREMAIGRLALTLAEAPGGLA